MRPAFAVLIAIAVPLAFLADPWTGVVLVATFGAAALLQRSSAR